MLGVCKDSISLRRTCCKRGWVEIDKGYAGAICRGLKTCEGGALLIGKENKKLGRVAVEVGIGGVAEMTSFAEIESWEMSVGIALVRTEFEPCLRIGRLSPWPIWTASSNALH